MDKAYVWVIEIRINMKYVPTAGAGLSRSDARRELRYDWQFNFPHDKFRITKYVRGQS